MSTIFDDINQLTGDIARFNDIIEGADNQTVAMAGGGIKPTVSKAIKDHFDAIQAAVQGRLTYETKATMDAAGAPPSGELAEVWNDSQSNNGLYGYTGGAWVKSSYDPFTEFGNRLDLSDGAAVATGSMSNQYFDRSVPLSSQVWENGTITVQKSIASTFTGWAAPIDWDGTPFDCIKLWYNIEFIGKPIRVRVWSADQSTLIAYATVYSNSGKYNWAVLDKQVTTSQVPAGIIYISYDVPDDSARLVPFTVTDYTDVADPTTYPQKYTRSTDNGELLTSWSNVTGGTGYPPAVELYDLSTLFGQDYINLDLMQETISNLQSVFNIVQQVEFGLETKVNGITSTPNYQSRSVAFSGWAVLVNKQAGESINAVRIPGYVTGITTVADQAAKIKVEIRDTTIGGALLAVGEVGIVPSQRQGEIYVPLKDPNTGNLLTLVDGDLPSVYAVMWSGEKQDGSRAIVGDNQATLTGYAGSSYYQNIGSGTWTTYSGNPSLGIETVFLSGLIIQDIYTYFGEIDLTGTDLYVDTYNVIAKDIRVAYDSAASQNVVTNPGYQNRAAPFNGWGNNMDPVVGDFNAIRLSFLSRSTPQSEAEKWSKIIFEVRDGTVPSGIIIANGTVDVDKESNLLSALVCLLKDPIIGNPITLQMADFVSGQMGITFRAVNEAGTNAICGESLGNPSNFSGNSYYTTNGGSSWSDYTSDTPQGIELLLLTNPVEEVAYRIRDTVKFPQEDALKTIELIGAPHLYALQGIEINLYFDNMIYQRDSDYSWDVACSQGEQWDERYRLISSDGSDKALTIQVRNPEDYADLWGEKSITIRVADTADGTGVSRKCMFIGDSTTAGGQYVGEVVNLASSDVIALTTVGTRGTAPALHEGRGGWRVNDYATAGRSYFRFNVTGVVTEPSINSTVYSHNGSEYRIQENHLTAGSGYLIAERTSGTNDPLSSGSLTKVSGTGDSTIGFDSWSQVSGNPFWNDSTQQVDFSNYMTENGFTMAADDWVFFHLGINDIFGQSNDSGVMSIALQNAARLETFIDSVQAYQAGIRIGMMVTIPPAKLQSAFGLNYQSGQTRDRYKRNILLYNKTMVDYFGGREGEGIYLCPVHYTVDPVWGFPSVMQNANSRTTEQVFRMTNGVHPNDSGYYQMADEIFAFLKYWA
jgi:lysophospholipase L1-like esterase